MEYFQKTPNASHSQIHIYCVAPIIPLSVPYEHVCIFEIRVPYITYATVSVCVSVYGYVLYAIAIGAVQ